MSTFSSLVGSYKRVTERVIKLLVDTLHNGFAMVGIVVLAVGLIFTTQPQLREVGEFKLFGWLHERQIEMGGMVTDLLASERATAVNPKDLPKQQIALALWLSKRYKVAPEPIGAIVAEAYDAGARSNLDPKLILAVMAIESGFNPFAQSAVGAQGLMQVMTKVHSDKYLNFGGKFAAFDPLANVRVGVKVLQDCIRAAGSVEGGLQRYVGATNLQDDGGYTTKVLSEYQRLQRVALGQAVSIHDNSNTISSVKAITPVPFPADKPEKSDKTSRLALN
jgi:hypothetical protein